MEEHISKITPEWESFRVKHAGLQDVKLFAYTGGDGMFGANGTVATDEELAQLRKFMESTHPPRPVFVDTVSVVGPEILEFQRKNQPVNGK